MTGSSYNYDSALLVTRTWQHHLLNVETTCDAIGKWAFRHFAVVGLAGIPWVPTVF